MQLLPDLQEARRLLDAGFKLVPLHKNSKQPVGDEWNSEANYATEIHPKATGYGYPLKPNNLCSVDPDDVDRAVVGLSALGFDLEDIMSMGVRTESTRPTSGGRATFRSHPELAWKKFSSKETGTVLELRANANNLQDCVPGVVYLDKETGGMCTQMYSPFTIAMLDDAPELPPKVLAWWKRLSTDVEFLREQQQKFFDALNVTPHLDVSAGGSLAYKSDCRIQFNRGASVESILERHGYTHDSKGRWAPPTATGAPAVREIPGKDGLWHSDHASDPLFGNFDAWVAYVVLDHNGDLVAAEDTCVEDVLGGFENYETTGHSDAVLSAIAAKIGMYAGDLGKAIGYRADVVTKVIQSTAWNPTNSKFFIMHEGLKISGREDFGTFSHDLFDDMYSYSELEDLAMDKVKGMTESKANAFIRGVMGAAVNKIAAIIRVRNQFTSIGLRIDPFATADSISLEDGVAVLCFQHKRLIGGDINTAHVNDFKNHFPEFDSLLELLVAARFASDRKQAHLWLQAPSNWGKSFMLGCLGEHNLVVETSISELELLFSGNPCGKTMQDFLRSWVLAVDEFKGVTREVKQLSEFLPVTPKGLPTLKVPLYLKVFLSAEDVPSLANGSGVEDQFANRFTHVKVAGTLDSRSLFMADKWGYRRSIVNYIAEQVNSLVDAYVELGVGGSANAANEVILGFYQNHRIDLGHERLSESLGRLVDDFVDWVTSAWQAQEVFGESVEVGRRVSREEKDLVSHVASCELDKSMLYLRNYDKAFDLWIGSCFDDSSRGAIKYKRGQIKTELLERKGDPKWGFDEKGAVLRNYVNGKQLRWIPLLMAGSCEKGLA